MAVLQWAHCGASLSRKQRGPACCAVCHQSYRPCKCKRFHCDHVRALPTRPSDGDRWSDFLSRDNRARTKRRVFTRWFRYWCWNAYVGKTVFNRAYPGGQFRKRNSGQLRFRVYPNLQSLDGSTTSVTLLRMDVA
jgi:hypothetical protein